MPFKENLLRKIKINAIATKLRRTIGPAASERRLNTPLMRELLDLSPLKKKTVRDLELYVIDGASGLRILVLDNDLAIYNTTVEDVALRKSPTVKEMISIKNAIKILNDKDVVVSKKEDTLETVRAMCIGMLDLSYTRNDIESIGREGEAALEMSQNDSVLECLTLFAELTGYTAPPKPFELAPYHIIGKTNKKPSGDILFGPAVIYDPVDNTLQLIDKALNSKDKDDIAWMGQVARRNEEASCKGAAVITFLENQVPPFQP